MRTSTSLIKRAIKSSSDFVAWIIKELSLSSIVISTFLFDDAPEPSPPSDSPPEPITLSISDLTSLALV